MYIITYVLNFFLIFSKSGGGGSIPPNFSTQNLGGAATPQPPTLAPLLLRSEFWNEFSNNSTIFHRQFIIIATYMYYMAMHTYISNFLNCERPPSCHPCTGVPNSEKFWGGGVQWRVQEFVREGGGEYLKGFFLTSQNFYVKRVKRVLM